MVTRTLKIPVFSDSAGDRDVVGLGCVGIFEISVQTL